MNTSNEHKKTLVNSERGTERGQQEGQQIVRHLPKTHVDHWFSRLRKRSYLDRASGKVIEIPDWQVRLKKDGGESWFNLGTANQAAAAKKAKEIFAFLDANGWPATLAKFKPDSGAATHLDVTVGSFLDETKAVSGLKPVTYEIYAKKFRSLVAGVFKIDGGTAKHDYVNGGQKQWLERIHAVRLEKLTPEKINDWKVRELKAASKSPLQLKHASVTLRSILLSSKALFNPNIRKHLTLRLPTPLPFEGVTLPEVGKSRYKSEIDPAVILIAARRELAEGINGDDQHVSPRPELFKILLLALGAGMRRDEIDKLQWRNIQWSKNTIRVETTEYGSTKSADSPRPESVKNHHYRCNHSFKELVAWLRSKGLKARNALHALRKEFGSQICAQAGIYAASVALRHSSINLTREYYIDKKQPAFFGVSKLMQEQPSGEQPAAVAGGKAA
jgi:integrase